MSEDQSDEVLMRLFQEGGEEAFKILFDRYSSHLINFAHRSFHNREEAEDAAQEALLRVYRGKDRYDVSRPFRPWIFSIIARLVSNRLRDKQRHPQESLDWTPDEASGIPFGNIPDKTSPLPEKSAEQKQLVQTVKAALDELPENQRTAVLLVRYHDMTYTEVAQAMNLSVPSIKSLLFRAHQQLRETLSTHVS